VTAISSADYAAIEAVNWSTLVHLATSAKLMEWRRDHPRKETEALRIGTALHAAVLEPDTFAKRYVAQPDLGDGRTKAGKEARAQWLASVPPGALVIDAEDHDLVKRCAAATLAHPEVRNLLRGGRAEEVVNWTDAESGLACKGRLDYIAPSYLLDLKSMRAETLPEFARAIAGRLYHGQVAFYFDGAAAARLLDPTRAQVFVIGVQTVEPYDVVPARIQIEDLERGRALYRSLLRRYAECRAANWYPGIAPGIVDLRLPEWTSSGAPAPQEDEW
jgi:exodeoxyribonuclease VIII